MIAALIEGTHDPSVLADLAKGVLRKKLPALREALEGRFRAHHALLASEILAHIDYLDEAIGRLSAEIQRVIAPFSDKVALLDTIPGVDRRAAETLLAEIGPDMTRFPTRRHLASWAGMCPGNNESAGKHGPGRIRKGPKWLREMLRESAKAASRSRGTHLASQYARLKGRRGHGKATVAVGHSILVMAYYVLLRDQPYQELGEDYLLLRDSTAAYTRRLVHQLERLGHKVTLEPSRKLSQR
jgi:transposase